ncbi:hypothetical protein [Legionella longbeachae]|uniref:hypothetical protein n=1 Tax=Legionella longbeachae TaxID=450 RepID=UPI000F747B48|nr:hypothetical protein [Legionella longbeachae]RZV26625.1 hypothetical protein EKG34_05660 [Legionella longbeachae]UAK47134.1 hypothetical protein K8O86_02790 [Legionella longbeachae]
MKLLQKIFLLFLVLIVSCSKPQPIRLDCTFGPGYTKTIIIDLYKNVGIDVYSNVQREGKLIVKDNKYEILFTIAPPLFTVGAFVEINRYTGDIIYESGSEPFGHDLTKNSLEFGKCKINKINKF